MPMPQAFSYTPPDLSGYLTSVTFSDIAGAAVLLSSGIVRRQRHAVDDSGGNRRPHKLKRLNTTYTVTQSDVTTHQAALSITESE